MRPKHRRRHSHYHGGKETEGRVLVPITSYLPYDLMDKIKMKSFQTGMPLAKYTSWILREYLISNPVRDVIVSIPIDTEYEPNLYIEEAGRVLEFLAKVGDRGIGIDYLIMCRHLVDIPEMEIFLKVLYDLEQSGVIFQFYPSNSRIGMKYRKVCIAPQGPEQRPSTRFILTDDVDV